MKIVIPTADYPPIEGGISTVSVQLARAFAKMGHGVTVVAPELLGTFTFDLSEPYEIVRYPGYRFGPLRVFPMLLTSWPMLKSADLIIAINVASSGVIGWLSNRIHGTRYLTLAYAYEFLKFQQIAPISAMLKALYRRSQFTVAISDFTRNALVQFGLDATRIAVIRPGALWPCPPSGVPFDSLKSKLKLESDTFILAVGRMVPRKGHETLVHAMPAILRRFPDVQLVLVGRGPRFDHAQALASDLGVTSNVIMAGYVTDDELAALYDQCTLFALPTGVEGNDHVEGFGLVFTEAAARGKPVVAGRSGGVVDAVVDGETGYLVDPGDVTALADRIVQLLADPGLAARFGAAGRDRVATELNWEIFTKRILDELERRP